MKTLLSQRKYTEAISRRFVKAMDHLRDIGTEKFRNGIGSEIGLSNTSINKIENGERGITIDAACRFCEIYNISAEWLFLGRGKMKLQSKKANTIDQLYDIKNTATDIIQKLESQEKPDIKK